MSFKKVTGKIKRFFSINLLMFIYLNYLNGHVVRRGKGKIIPFRGTHIEMQQGAKWLVSDGNIYLNSNKIGRSRAECLILLRKNAVWEANGETVLYYGAGVQVHEGGRLCSSDLYMNTGSLIICGKEVQLGKTVSMARYAFILDDDHHPIYNAEDKVINEAEKIVIGNQVWLGMKTTILKGAQIGDQSVIGANAVVASKIPEGVMIGSPVGRPVMKGIHWHR